MFSYEDLTWSLLFPLACAVMMWFSIDLALLVRAGSGRRRRLNARRAIHRFIRNSPVVGTSSDGGSIHDGVVVPAAMRIATKAVVRRAVVVVGGDFARSPRMQYHAASLARCGSFDEVVLIGLDCGNQLSESLLKSGTAGPASYVSYERGPSNGKEEGNNEPCGYAVRSARSSRDRPEASTERGGSDAARWYPRQLSGCLLSTRYVVSPPSPPDWFQVLFGLKCLNWIACTAYKAIAYALQFAWLMLRASATRVNSHGQLLLTDLILIQSPPSVPFTIVAKIVRVMVLMYDTVVYYLFIVPASWMNTGALRDIREQCCRRSRPAAAGPSSHYCDGDNAHLVGSVVNGVDHSSLERTVKKSESSRSSRWVFYPALVVDWHNYGYTILKAAHRPALVMWLYKTLELNFGDGDVNVTVSRAMRESLRRNLLWDAEKRNKWLAMKRVLFTEHLQSTERDSEREQMADGGVEDNIVVLYDVAPSFFGPTSRLKFLTEVVQTVGPKDNNSGGNSYLAAVNGSELQTARAEEGSGSTGSSATSVTNSNGSSSSTARGNEKSGDGAAEWGIAPPPAWIYEDLASPSSDGGPNYNSSRPQQQQLRRQGIIIVGSTSWTPDDDYSLVVEALQRLDHRLAREYGRLAQLARQKPQLLSAQPLKVWLLITGKGPSRARFEDAVLAAGLSEYVTVSTVYLQSYQQYALTLGAADVGLCLHISSSGLDLPMKGVDMIGAGIPVLALRYGAIYELMGEENRITAGQQQQQCDGVGECERGWLFSSATDLEYILASLVGLQGDGRVTRNGRTLAEAQAQARARRAAASTWEDSWQTTLYPVVERLL